MPKIKISEWESDPHPPREQEETAAKRPRLEPVEAPATEPGRPHQDFVESEVRKYWQEIGKKHKLTKPIQQEIRAAAMPILCQALRNRTGHRRHKAVAEMVQHAMERRWIKRPFSEAYASPSYVDALIQLADDAHWLAREIPLPYHPPPRHPVIYYTFDLNKNRLVPREDSLLRGDYVHVPWTGSRLTKDNYIYPWPELCLPDESDLLARNWEACYTLYTGAENKVEIMLHWIERIEIEQVGDISMCCSMPLSVLIFSKHQPASAST